MRCARRLVPQRFGKPRVTGQHLAKAGGDGQPIAQVVLHGVRGGPKADLNALVDAIMRVQRIAVDGHDTIAELDINPLLARPNGCVALDALVIPKEI